MCGFGYCVVFVDGFLGGVGRCMFVVGWCCFGWLFGCR